MKPKSAKQKGRLLEQFVVDRLRIANLDARAYPQKGSGSGKNKGDIWNSLDLHFECKNQKSIHWKSWKQQMSKDNVSHFPEILVWHPPRDSIENSVVIIDWYFFESLLQSRRLETYKSAGYPETNSTDTIKIPIKIMKEKKTTGFNQCIHKSKLCCLCHLRPKGKKLDKNKGEENHIYKTI